ncbi:MAG TPA: PAS domain-containing sensor histidine kinase [Desulfobacterales bacterium]|nr:PAS domain-containing sensor histidine kinase [Desulfobacterales bacterium]
MKSLTLDTIFSLRPEGTLCCDLSGEIVFFNPAFKIFFKSLSTDDLFVGGNIFDLLPSRYRELWRLYIGQPTGEDNIISLIQDDKVRYWQLSFASSPADDEAGWSLLVRDITPLQSQLNELRDSYQALENQFIDGADQIETNIILAREISERKIAQEKLSESKERLSQIIDGNSIPTFVLDKNHRITHWNKALARLTGLAYEEVIGRDVQWRAFYSHKRPTMADLVLEKAPEREIKRFYDHKYRRSVLLKDSYEVEDRFEWQGEHKWLFFTAAPLINRAGEIIGAVETLQDITDRKEMEEKFLLYQDILEKRVKERTTQLQKTYEQLLHAEKLSAVGKLAASIAHEFGNPIIGIRNFLIGLHKTAIMDQDDSEMLDLAIEECQRVKDLISNLQNFNRPTSGAASPMDIHKAIDDMLLFCKKSFKENKILVKKDYQTQMPRVVAVVDQIKQVILNCLNNAQEAIYPGQGIISISTEVIGNMALLHIKDTGKGIKENDLIHIFEPFFSTKPAVEGTGLGLSVSYGIMKKHRGNIEVTETSAQGTTFTISLPIS